MRRAGCDVGQAAGRRSVSLAVVLIAASYPGWLHPWGQQRPLAMDVEPNPSMKQAAEQIQALRDTACCLRVPGC